MLQTGSRNFCRQNLHFAWYAAGSRQPFQTALGPDALLEHFQLTAVPQQRHRHRPGRPQQDLQQLHFLGGKVGEAVQVHVFARRVAGLLQVVDELLHPVPAVRSALGIAIYGMFLAIIIPPAKKHPAVRRVLLLAVFLSCLIAWSPLSQVISSGFSIILCTLAAAGAGAWLFPREEAEGHGQ